MTGTLPLQPGCVRLMLVRDVDTGTITDADVFFDGDNAIRAREALPAGLDGEFRDYRPDRLNRAKSANRTDRKAA